MHLLNKKEMLGAFPIFPIYEIPRVVAFGEMKIKAMFTKDNALPLIGAFVLAVLAFSFGESLLVSVAGTILFALAILLLFGANRKFDKGEKVSFWMYAGPFLLFLLTCSLGVFQINSYANAFSGIVAGLLSFLGMAGCFFFGIAAKLERKIDRWLFVYSLLGGLALLVLVSWISTMVLYGPWHTIIYAGKQYYWHGVAYDVDNEVAFLLGTSIARVSINYAGGFSTVLASSGTALLFIDWKKERGKGIFLSVVAGIGILFAISVPLVASIAVTAVVYLLALGLRFMKLKEEAPKWIKIASIAIVSVFGIVLAAYFGIILSNSNSLFSEGILRKIFNNGRWTKPINDVISATFYHNGDASFLSLLFGMNPFYSTSVGTYYNRSLWSSTPWISTDLKTFEIVPFMEGGLVGFLSFLAFLFSTIVLVYLLIHDEKKSPFSLLVGGIGLGYAAYMTFFMDMTPYVLQSEANAYVSPFGGSVLFSSVLFLVGLSYRPVYFRRKFALEVRTNEEE